MNKLINSLFDIEEWSKFIRENTVNSDSYNHAIDSKASIPEQSTGIQNAVGLRIAQRIGEREIEEGTAYKSRYQTYTKDVLTDS